MSDEELPGAGIIEPTAKLITARASDIDPEEIVWLWSNRVAIGKVTMLAGDPGLGKSMITIDVAARVTTGAIWPVDGGRAPIGSVLFVADEDGMADTQIPRLIAAGADLDKVHIQRHILDTGTLGDPQERWLSLDADLQLIEEKVLELGDVKLIVVDPVSAYMGTRDDRNNAEVRAVLGPLGKLAERVQAAVLAISHFKKSDGPAAYKIIGSIAYVAAVRSSLLVAKDQDDADRRLVLPGKNNLAPTSIGGLAFRIQQNAAGRPYVDWEPDAVTATADEVLDRMAEETTSAVDEAAEFLRDYLKNGPKPAEEVVSDAGKAGIAKRTLDRAKKKIGAFSGKREFSGKWSWSLTPFYGSKDANQPLTGNVGKVGNLRDVTREDCQKTEDCQDFPSAEDGNDGGNLGGGPWRETL